MDKESLKKISIIYYLYKETKKIAFGTVGYVHYINSLNNIMKNKKVFKKR